MNKKDSNYGLLSVVRVLFFGSRINTARNIDKKVFNSLMFQVNETSNPNHT